MGVLMDRMICDICSNKMEERQCKLTCPNCGYKLDCSDLTLYVNGIWIDEYPLLQDNTQLVLPTDQHRYGTVGHRTINGKGIVGRIRR